MSNFTITGSITIGGTYNGLTITNGSISGVTFTATTINATTVNATTVSTTTASASNFVGGAYTGTTFNGVTLNNNAWTTYTPTITAGSGTFTTTSASGRYQQIGKTVFVFISIVITTNGSAATFVQATLPVTGRSDGYVLAGRENAVAGLMLQGFISAGVIQIVNYDNTYPGGNGKTLLLSGLYEAA